jgi:acetylornithine deacetylase
VERQLPALPVEVPASLPWVERLMRFDTTSRNSNLDLVAALEEEMTRLGLAAERLPNEDGSKANLLLTLPAADGSVGGGLVFNPEIRDGRLYGRGAADMKSFLGVVVHRLPDLAAARLSRPIHLAFSYDEEVGCLGGAELSQFLGSREAPPALCIVGEPTSMRVIAGHKSTNLVQLTFHGRAAHSSLTPEGVNAIEYAARAVTAIRTLAEGRRVDGPFDPAYRVPWTTAGVNMVLGGIATNTVPDRCRIVCEFRTVGDDDPVPVIEMMRAEARRLQAEMQAEYAGASVEVEVLAQVPGLESSSDGHAYQLAVELGGTPSPDKVTYGTEAGQFARHGIDAIVCGPGDIAQAHAANEYIELDQIVACEQFVDRLLIHLNS